MFDVHSNRFLLRTVIVVVAITSLSVLAVAAVRNLGYFSVASPSSDSLYSQVQSKPSTPITIEQDADTPLRILSADVKQITSAEYSSMAGQRAPRSLMISAPTVRLRNESSQTIESIMLIVQDPVKEFSKGIRMTAVNLEPGREMTITPLNFVAGQAVSSVDDGGNLRSSASDPALDPRFWLPFDSTENLRVRVAVEFTNGGSWFNAAHRGE
jgi:hypothetical protein